MELKPLLQVIAASLFAAVGQLLFKTGANGATGFHDYLNSRLALGFLLYGLSSVLWVMALSRAPLSRVYPFTILTFVLVYVSSFVLLGERVTGQVIGGAALTILGLVVIVTA